MAEQVAVAGGGALGGGERCGGGHRGARRQKEGKQRAMVDGQATVADG